MQERGHFPGLMLAPIPCCAVVSPAGQRPTCWVGEEERQCWKRRLRSSHRSLHVEPEMIPFLYWSHWRGEGRERSSAGAAPRSSKEVRQIEAHSHSLCSVAPQAHALGACKPPPASHAVASPAPITCRAQTPQAPFLQQGWGQHFGFSIYRE